MTPKAWNRVYVFAALLVTGATHLSCQPAPSKQQTSSGGWFAPKGSTTSVERVRLGLQVDRYDSNDEISLTSARNEWIDFALRLQGLSAKQAKTASIRLTPLKR